MALLEARNGIYEIRYYTLSHFSQNWVIPVISGFGGMGDRFDSILPPDLIVIIACY